MNEGHQLQTRFGDQAEGEGPAQCFRKFRRIR